MAGKAYRDPTGDAAIKAADRSAGIDVERALLLADLHERRGDHGSAQRFRDLARRGRR